MHRFQFFKVHCLDRNHDHINGANKHKCEWVLQVWYLLLVGKEQKPNQNVKFWIRKKNAYYFFFLKAMTMTFKKRDKVTNVFHQIFLKSLSKICFLMYLLKLYRGGQKLFLCRINYTGHDYDERIKRLEKYKTPCGCEIFYCVCESHPPYVLWWKKIPNYEITICIKLPVSRKMTLMCI